ncbi:MAG: oligosaccharide flippase family protein [Bacteroidetes bacterium]|nr:oligosaccharide flippase family protein [Bacteroidota bacterium]
MSILATGSGIAKLVGLVAMPVITRIYGPEDFGILAVFAASLSLMVPFSTLKYSIMIPIPKTEVMAMNTAVLSFIVLLITLIVSFFILLFGAEFLFVLLNTPEMVPYWWLLLIGLFVSGYHEILTSWATRMKTFSKLAKISVLQTILSSVTKIVLGVASFKPVGLIIGNIVASGAGIYSLTKLFIYDIREYIPHVTKKRLKLISLYYLDLPKYRLPSQFLLVIATKLPILFFAFNFSSEETGQLGLAFTVIAIPIGLIGNSTSKAYYAEVAQIGPKKSKEIWNITKSTFKRLAILALIPILVLLTLSPLLFSIVFGSQWVEAGEYTSILAIYLMCQFITSPLVKVLTVYNRQKLFLYINLTRMVLITIMFALCYYYEADVYVTLMTYSIVISGHYIFTGYQVFRIIKSNK